MRQAKNSQRKYAANAGNLDSKSEQIFQGFVTGWNKLADWVKSQVDENNEAYGLLRFCNRRSVCFIGAANIDFTNQ